MKPHRQYYGINLLHYPARHSAAQKSVQAHENLGWQELHQHTSNKVSCTVAVSNKQNLASRTRQPKINVALYREHMLISP